MELSKKYNKSVGQIILRFDLQRGLIPIPKSSNTQRQYDNINIFDFNIYDEDMDIISKCNINFNIYQNLVHVPVYEKIF